MTQGAAIDAAGGQAGGDSEGRGRRGLFAALRANRAKPSETDAASAPASSGNGYSALLETLSAERQVSSASAAVAPTASTTSATSTRTPTTFARPSDPNAGVGANAVDEVAPSDAAGKKGQKGQTGQTGQTGKNNRDQGKIKGTSTPGGDAALGGRRARQLMVAPQKGAMASGRAGAAGGRASGWKMASSSSSNNSNNNGNGNGKRSGGYRGYGDSSSDEEGGRSSMGRKKILRKG